MKSIPRRILPLLIPALTACLVTFATAGEPKIRMANPDFTKGDKIPQGATYDINLGATGTRGWMFSENLVTTSARQISITKVDKGSPADGILTVGDVILGVGGKPFSYDPRTEMGKALTIAESETGGGKLSLTRWRAGKSEEIGVKLPVLGSYSATAPYDCPKSKRILELGCEALAKRMAEPSYRLEPITRSINALALLASGNPKYLPLVKNEATWAAGYSATSKQPWYYGYVIMLLSEYHMATGDDSIMPGLRRMALEAANGQSAVGSWGHGFANPDGRLGGYGMMNSPGVPLTISLVLARKAGISDPNLDQAIERSARLLRFYIGKGAVPYGDHAPWIQNHDDNGKCGMAAVLFDQLGEANGAEFFSRMGVAAHSAERDGGHTGNFFNILWSMPGVARSGPQATGAWMNEFGAWYFDLARRWDGSFRHQGAPKMDGDKYNGWDATGGYLLAYAMPLKKIYLTGKRASIAPQVDAATAKALILDGRGWDYKNGNNAYDALSVDELLKRLESWSPIVRERAAMALGSRKDVPMPALLELLESNRIESRYGACAALALLKDSAAPAVPALRNSLHHDDLWLRIKAAGALAAIGKPAMVAVPEMLELLTTVDVKNDPRGMQQRYLTSALFAARNGLLGNSLEGVDRELLYKAVRAGLKNEDGAARSCFGSVYRNLSIEEIKPLLPAILQAVVVPSPSGEMFADGVRLEGLDLMATHHIEEGIQACVNYTRTQNPWGNHKRTSKLMKVLCKYGARAKPMIPELEKIAAEFDKGEARNLSAEKAATVRDAIRKIKDSNENPELIRIQ